MTRAQLEKDYVVNRRGIIRTLGKFEGQPIYAPYFWDVGMNGGADDERGKVLIFNVDADDIKEFPELKGSKVVKLREDDQGFVQVI